MKLLNAVCLCIASSAVGAGLSFFILSWRYQNLEALLLRGAIDKITIKELALLDTTGAERLTLGSRKSAKTNTDDVQLVINGTDNGDLMSIGVVDGAPQLLARNGESEIKLLSLPLTQGLYIKGISPRINMEGIINKTKFTSLEISADPSTPEFSIYNSRDGKIAKLATRIDIFGPAVNLEREGKDGSRHFADLATGPAELARLDLRKEAPNGTTINGNQLRSDGQSMVQNEPAYPDTSTTVTEEQRMESARAYVEKLSKAKRLHVGLSEEGNPFIDLLDKEGNSRTIIGTTTLERKTGSTVTRPANSIVMFDKNSKVTWATPE